MFALIAYSAPEAPMSEGMETIHWSFVLLCNEICN